MPAGDKTAYTQKQKRQAKHIARGYRESGKSPRRAAEIAWKTVNKQTGGGRRRPSKSRSRSS